MVLNESALRRAEPGSILWDGSLPGFGLRVGKNFRTWIVLVSSGRRKKLGRHPFMSLGEARSEARKILAEKTLGKIVPKHVAFENAKKDFLEDCKGRLKPSTLTQYEWCLGLLPFDRQNVAGIAGHQLIKVFNGLTASNKEHCFRVARTFFTWCYKSHIIEKNPMERLDSPPSGKSRERVLTDDELKMVYKEAKTFKTTFHRLIWLLLMLGQRLGETRKLKAPYFTKTALTIPADLTKNGRTHVLPLPKGMHKTVMKWHRFTDYIFPSVRSHVRGKQVECLTATWSAMQDFHKASGTSDWSSHDLRRTFATGLQKLGVRLEVTEALLNHVSGTRAGVTGIYQRYGYEKEALKALTLWHRKLAKL